MYSNFLIIFFRPYDCATAIVLTADCDLAENKHYGRLLMCPVVPIKDYLKDEWAKRRLQKTSRVAGDKIRCELKKITILEGDGDISDGVIDAISESVEAMESALSGMNSVPAKLKDDLLRHVRVRVECEKFTGNFFQALVCSTKERDSSDDEKATKKIWDDFRSEMKSDSTDVVVVPDELKGENAASVVLLRCPFSLMISEVSSARDSLKSVTRIGRLCLPVKYLVAQKFGFLFSRFGMPPSIENDRNVAVELEDLKI